MRQVSQSDARLVVSVNSPGTTLGAEALAALAAAAAEIVDLNLADTALDDAGLAAIGALPAATHLRLARNQLTDAGLARARRARRSLRYLNLYGNAGITDAGVAALGAIATLREVYLWGTGVSIQGAAAASQGAPRPRRRCRLPRGRSGRAMTSETVFRRAGKIYFQRKNETNLISQDPFAPTSWPP